MSATAVRFVGIFFSPTSGWWWPVDQVPARIRALSTTTLVYVLRTGVLEGSRNPAQLIDALVDELRRRLEAREEMPVSLTEEEIERWTSITAPSAARG
ncbi:MAG: hypothetical protein NTW87_12395 [Planctomycetota bacterium]|nr:hypothetical protein [Planctomycetota bacterium]